MAITRRRCDGVFSACCCFHVQNALAFAKRAARQYISDSSTFSTQTCIYLFLQLFTYTCTVANRCRLLCFPPGREQNKPQTRDETNSCTKKLSLSHLASRHTTLLPLNHPYTNLTNRIEAGKFTHLPFAPKLLKRTGKFIIISDWR